MALDLRDSFQKVNYDIYTGEVYSDFWGKQGDTGRGFDVTIWDEGQLIVPSTEILRLNLRKPDGKIVWVESYIVGNAFRIELTNQVFVEVGEVKSEFEIVSQGKVRKSETFIIESRESMASGIQSENQFGRLEFIITKIEAFEVDMDDFYTSEAQRDLNEGVRISSENTRITNETNRQTRESERQSNESTRISQEDSRISSENTRVSDENIRKSNETSRISAEGTRVNQENTRKSQETSRVNAEDSRITAEIGRVNAENTRVTAESSRATAESARVTAENTRDSQENTRKSNETSRQSAETGRVNAEVLRNISELSRKDSETERNNAESIRISNEITRVSSEEDRIYQESLRVESEGDSTKGRIKAENLRVVAEQGRVTAESTRVSNEDSRTSAESGRVTAESTRVSQELSRVNSEGDSTKGRVKAENLRVAAENGRVSAENIRSTNESTRQNNESTRISNENTRISQESTRQANTSSALQQMSEAVQSTMIIYKEAVASFSNIATTYPNPELGWRVEVNDTKKIYRYNGNAWINISDAALGFAPENVANKGQASGYAPLDENSKVPLSNLPPLNYIPTSEKASVNGVASLGSDGKVPSSQLPPLDYAPSSHTHTRSQITDLGTVASINTNASTSNYLRGDGTWVTPPNTTYSEITEAEILAGTASTSRTITARRLKYLMDNVKTANSGNADTVNGLTVLTAVPSGAVFTDTVYTHPSSHPATMITEDASHRFVTDTEKITWNGKANTATTLAGYGITDAATYNELYTYQQHVGETFVEKSALIDLIYPIGSIYMSVNNVSPATFLGGTWSALSGRFLLGANSTYTAGSTGGSATHTLTTAEMPSHSHTINHAHGTATSSSTSVAHTHSVSATTGNNSADHAHTYSGTTANNNVGHTHSVPALSGTAASAGAHSHSTRYKGFAITASADGWMVLRRNEPNDSYDGTDSDGAISAGAHTHSVSTTASTTGGISANHTHTFSGTTTGASANHNHTFSTTSGAMSANATHTHTVDVPSYSGSSGSNGSGNAHNNMPPYLSVYMWKRTL